MVPCGQSVLNDDHDTFETNERLRDALVSAWAKHGLSVLSRSDTTLVFGSGAGRLSYAFGGEAPGFDVTLTLGKKHYRLVEYTSSLASDDVARRLFAALVNVNDVANVAVHVDTLAGFVGAALFSDDGARALEVRLDAFDAPARLTSESAVICALPLAKDDALPQVLPPVVAEVVSAFRELASKPGWDTLVYDVKARSAVVAFMHRAGLVIEVALRGNDARDAQVWLFERSAYDERLADRGSVAAAVVAPRAASTAATRTAWLHDVASALLAEGRIVLGDAKVVAENRPIETDDPWA
jgi:hypothetical protein